MNVRITVKHVQIAIIDIGDLPVDMISALLNKNEGTFDGNWCLGDVPGGDDKWVVESI